MKEIMDALIKLQEAQIRAELKPGEENSTTRKWRKLVPKPIQGHFDRLRAREKKGVAIIRNGTCTACYIKVALGVMLILRNASDIQLCGNCGRYLSLPDDEVLGTVAEKARDKEEAKEKKKAAKKKAKEEAAEE